MEQRAVLPGAVGELARTTRRWLFGQWLVLRRDRELVACARLFEGARALEVGGPSAIFRRRGALPVYPRLAALDILDFAGQTLWSPAQPQEGLPGGARLIGEAGELGTVPDRAYDVVLASHVVEHLANPLGALERWREVVREEGLLTLVLPHRDATFDHRRPVTPIEHLREDHRRATPESDLSHVEEVLALHDYSRSPEVPGREEFERRCLDNARVRALHHHVFTTRSVAALCEAAGLRVLMLRAVLPFDIVAVCRVTEASAAGIEEPALHDALARSPFPSDRAQ